MLRKLYRWIFSETKCSHSWIYRTPLGVNSKNMSFRYIVSCKKCGEAEIRTIKL